MQGGFGKEEKPGSGGLIYTVVYFHQRDTPPPYCVYFSPVVWVIMANVF